jgi:hypothetical protein
VREQEAAAWHHAFMSADALKPVFESAAARNSEIGAQYKSLAQIYEAAPASAKLAVTHRRANAKKRGAKASGSSTATHNQEVSAPVAPAATSAKTG